MTAFFRVRSFEKFQHYKDRNPPWIKLYGEILERYEFCALPDASKAHLIAIWLLASRTGNRIPMDPIWVAAKIGARSAVDLECLIKAEFIEVITEATADVAERHPDASNVLGQRREESEQRESRAEQTAREAEGKSPEPEIDAGRGVIELFDRVGEEIFGQQRRPFPAGDDIVFARRWITAGADLGLLEGLFRSRMGSKRSAGEGPIASLKFFDGAVNDAIRKALTDIPDFLRRRERPARPQASDTAKELDDVMAKAGFGGAAEDAA